MMAATRLLAVGVVLSLAASLAAQNIQPEADKWLTVTGVAAGNTLSAQDEATKQALRQAVEQGVGVFLTSESKSDDYQAVYDKIFADAVGFVKEYKVTKSFIQDGKTHVTVTALVSTQKFEKDWAVIRHTVHQEENPRVIIAIAEATRWTASGPAFDVDEAGIVQGLLEKFFLEKGILLVDRDTAGKVGKRDLLLASLKDDPAEIAAIGARFRADVVITGKATVQYGGKTSVQVGDVTVDQHRYVGAVTIRAVRSDSAQVLISEPFDVSVTTTQQHGGEVRALNKMGEEAAPKVLKSVINAWRKQVHVTRNVTLQIGDMDYGAWKKFKDEAGKIRGVQALRLREITESVAQIDAEWAYSVQNLADRLLELKDVSLSVIEISSNRIKLKVVQ